MKHLKLFLPIVILTLYLFGNSLCAQIANDTISPKINATVILKDNLIAAALDSLSVLKCFEKSCSNANVKSLNKYNYTAADIPAFNDSIYVIRIANLNAKSPFGLVYNEDVKGFINLYAVKKRQLTSRLLGLSEYYFPLFEEYLDKYHLPLELKYLAIVESALNPVAKSPAGAGGLWQFMYSTGKMYGLDVTSYIDERADPAEATRAACEHFRDLYAVYKNWSLVLAAYNSGPGNVNKAIRKANGETDFWKIKKYLPRETQGYVPAFIAVNYVMNYAAEHNLYPVAPIFKRYDIDTVTVKQRLTFGQVSEALNIPIEEITFLNPCYKEGVIPAFADENYPMCLQKKYVGDFITNEKTIYAFKTKAMLEEERKLAEKQKEIRRKDSLLAIQKQNASKKNHHSPVVNNIPDSVKVDKTTANTENSGLNKAAVIYTVKAGDGLGIIASRYKCTIGQLQAWNKLTNMNIYPGQRLYVQDPFKKAEGKDTIYNKVPETNIKTENVSANDQTTNLVTSTTQKQVKYVYHTVQKGDTLWSIASQYKGVTVVEIIKLNNLSDSSTIHIGQKLKVAVAS